MSIIYEPKGAAREYSELAANLRHGCPHGCKYCYVPDTPYWRRQPNSKELFHSQCEARDNVLLKVENDCKRLEGDSREVLLSFTTDPYIVGENNTITRDALSIFEKYNMRVQVLTKGGMEAAKDFDILARNDWKFASTLLFTNDDNRQEWEPNAATVQSRIDAIRTAHKMGIQTWVSVEPVIYPDEALELIHELKESVDVWKIGKLNHMPAIESKINWSEFLTDARRALGNSQYIIKNDLLAYDDTDFTTSLGESSSGSLRPKRHWSSDSAKLWAQGARPHVIYVLSILAMSDFPMTTEELCSLTGIGTNGAIVGGLNAWAKRKGLPRPLVQTNSPRKGYIFASNSLCKMFADAMGATDNDRLTEAQVKDTTDFMRRHWVITDAMNE